ncbi:MAG: hypothetical protein AAF211_21610 [Myxococcota bacterium]
MPEAGVLGRTLVFDTETKAELISGGEADGTFYGLQIVAESR